MIDWTHKNVSLTDIRKINKYYLLKLPDEYKIFDPLLVNISIFDQRLCSYFLKEISDVKSISREDILKIKWNLYITQGFYIKIDKNEEIVKYDQDSNKWYVSYLDIASPLGVLSPSNLKEKTYPIQQLNS